MTGPDSPHLAADAVSETFAAAEAAARTVADHLGRHTYRWTTERDLQRGIGAVLAEGFEHCRAEAAISAKTAPTSSSTPPAAPSPSKSRSADPSR